MHAPTERIVVTGGAGFIGSHVVERLLNDAVEHVVLVDDFSRGRFTNLSGLLNQDRLTIVQADIRDLTLVSQAIDGASLVIHLAARTSDVDDGPDVEGVFTTNVGGTFNVLRAAARHQVPRVVFASSYAAYGIPIGLPVDEDHPLHAADLTGASKVSGEAYCRAFRRVFGLQTVILRLAEVYGSRDCSGQIATWLRDARDGRDLTVAEKDRVCDFVWIDDAVEAIMRAARAETGLPPINIASGTGTRVIDVARRIARLAGNQSRVRASVGEVSEPRRFVAEVERMHRILKIDPPLDPLGRLDELVLAPNLVAAS